MAYDASALLDDSANPLKANGIDPHDAAKDPQAVMAYLQNRQYVPGIEKPSALKDNSAPLAPSQVPMATASEPQTDFLGSLIGKPSMPAGANVSNDPVQTTDPDLENARKLALQAQERTEQNQTRWDALNQRQETLEAQRAKDSSYIDPKGASALTGKSYNPSTGRQVLRGIMGGVEGLMKGGFRGAVLGGLDPRNAGVAGYKDPNAQYGRDVARQQATVASDDKQLAELKDNAKIQYDAGRNLGTDTTANAKTYGDIFTTKKNAETAATAARQADIRQQHEDEVEQHNRAHEAETDARNTVLDRNATTQARRADAMISKLSREPNNGLKGRDAAKVQAYAEAHGLDPDHLTPDQLGEALRIGSAPPHTANRQVFEQHWQAEFAKGNAPFDRERNTIVRRGAVLDVTKNPNAWADLDDDEKAKITAELNDLEQRRTAANSSLQQEKDAEASQAGVYGKQAASAPQAAQPANPSQPKPAATAQSKRAGDTRTYNGATYKFDGKQWVKQ